MRRSISAAAITFAFLLSACGGDQRKSASSSDTPELKTSGTVDPTKLVACLQQVGGKPVRSTDNELYAGLVQDPDFKASYDAWRGDSFPEGYASIYTWVYGTEQGAGRAVTAQSADPENGDLADGLHPVDNIVWTTDLDDPPAAQQRLFDGCVTRARS